MALATCLKKQAEIIIKNGLNARALLDYRLAGGPKFLVDLLAKQHQTVLADIKTETFDSTNQSIVDIFETLTILSCCCQDCDFAVDFATFGGHKLLKQVLVIDLEMCDLVEGVHDVICAITSSGNIYPSRNLVSDRTSEVVRPSIHKFTELSRECKVLEAKQSVHSENFAVYLRSIPLSIIGTGQHAVGYLLWSSAVILSRLIVQNKETLVHDRRVLECGAGLGLCGIVSGRYAKAVTLSDFSEVLVRNLEYNISK
jgi:Lysine methyltransferase